MIHRQLVGKPIHHRLHGVSLHRVTGFAVGRQRVSSPALQTALVQQGQQQPVGYINESLLPRLPVAAIYLPVAQPKLLLCIRIKSLSTCLLVSIHPQQAEYFPKQTAVDQRLARFPATEFLPKQDNTHRTNNRVNAYAFAEILMEALVKVPRLINFLGNGSGHIHELATRWFIVKEVLKTTKTCFIGIGKPQRLAWRQFPRCEGQSQGLRIYSPLYNL